MNKVVFVNIDKPKLWSEWHSGKTNRIYYSDFYDTEEEVNKFLQQMKLDYPDSNLTDNKYGREYYIEYIVLNFDKNNKVGFETLCNIMGAYRPYTDRKK